MKDSGRYRVFEFSLFREGDGSDWERCTWKAAYPNLIIITFSTSANAAFQALFAAQRERASNRCATHEPTPPRRTAD
jgi:hypothetical protein